MHSTETQPSFTDLWQKVRANLSLPISNHTKLQERSSQNNRKDLKGIQTAKADTEAMRKILLI